MFIRSISSIALLVYTMDTEGIKLKKLKSYQDLSTEQRNSLIEDALQDLNSRKDKLEKLRETPTSNLDPSELSKLKNDVEAIVQDLKNLKAFPQVSEEAESVLEEVKDMLAEIAAPSSPAISSRVLEPIFTFSADGPTGSLGHDYTSPQDHLLPPGNGWVPMWSPVASSPGLDFPSHGLLPQETVINDFMQDPTSSARRYSYQSLPQGPVLGSYQIEPMPGLDTARLPSSYQLGSASGSISHSTYVTSLPPQIYSSTPSSSVSDSFGREQVGISNPVYTVHFANYVDYLNAMTVAWKENTNKMHSGMRLNPKTGSYESLYIQ